MQQTQATRILDHKETYPLSQPKFLKLVANFLSYVFHPLFISVYVAIYLIYFYPYAFARYDHKQKLLTLAFVFSITVFFPALTIFLLWRLKFASSIYLRTQKERIIPYVASITYFFWAFYVSRNMPGSPQIMTFFFLGTFLAASAALMANNYFKISMHAIGVSGAATFMILLGVVSGEPISIPIAIATLIAGIVCSARLIVSDHHPYEIYWGLIIGTLCQLIACYFIM
ncbi:MAG: hypothetical protein M3040_10960 [Bacteroidota bacterium]|nr:hypothetical protein [Bacteroidota bacterium]